MDDDTVPGLMDYINADGVIDSPVNRTAYRTAWFMCQMFNRQLKDDTHGIAVVYSEVLDRHVAVIGRFLSAGFVALQMVMQEDLPMALDIRCVQGCEGHDGAGCTTIVRDYGGSQTDDNQPSNPETRPDSATVNRDFEHIVQSWDGDVPDMDWLSQFYPPTEGEGGGPATSH